MKKISTLFLSACLLAGFSVNAEVLNEGFEGEEFAPEGWSIIEATGHSEYSGWSRATNKSNSGTASARLKHAYQASNYLVTPQLRPEAGESLVFYAISDDNSKSTVLNIKLSTTENDENSFSTTLVTYSTSTKEDNRLVKDWDNVNSKKIIDLSAYAGQKIYIAFHVEGDDNLNIYLDDVSGVTLAGNANCDAPTALTVNSVVADAASFSWTPSGAAQYQFACALAGSAVDWSAAQTTSEASASLSGLVEGNEYVFYVRSFCSVEEQSSAQSVAFKTLCVDASLPWKCGFEDVAKLGMPDCWTALSDNNFLYVQVDEASDDDYEEEVYTYAHSGTHFLSFTGGGPSSANLAVLPAFSDETKNMKLFFWYNTGYVGDDYAKPELGYVTNPVDANSFVSLKTLDQCVDYQFVSWDLAELPSNVSIAIRIAGGNSNNGKLRIDDMEINSEYTAVSHVNVQVSLSKYIENGRLVIVRDGIKYNALGLKL